MQGPQYPVAKTPSQFAKEDPYLWLEEVQGEKPLEWAKARSAISVKELTTTKDFPTIEKEVRAILLAKDRIPMPALRGKYVFNFWQDPDHVRGLWRRTTVESYRTPAPAWETVIDLDALSNSEKENWVWHGSQCLAPKNERCLISLSRGGKDAVVVREFDLASKTFVKGGFELPEAKSHVNWKDEDTVWVATDFGPDTMTTSGYPRIVKLWTRGEPLEKAITIFEGREKDMAVGAQTYHTPDGDFSVVYRELGFYEAEHWEVQENRKLKKLKIPDSAQIQGFFQGRLLISLREKWSKYARITEGSLIGWSPKGEDPWLLFKPERGEALMQVETSSEEIWITYLQKVASRMIVFGKDPSGKMSGKPVKFGELGSFHLVASDSFQPRVYASFESYLRPLSLQEFQNSGSRYEVKRLPEQFNSDDMNVSQIEAVSADGTKIPYFLVHSKKMKANLSTPVILYGYGGFEVSMTPTYLGIYGKSWVERGGAYAVANIRGGGEFGPSWHRAALKENRQRAFDDFAAVARDLTRRKIAPAAKIGIHGGSNGGLLVGASLTQHPELFGAVVCEVPLLDMLRYTKLLAGASWMAEYGDPEVSSERRTLLKYSPYHNVQSPLEKLYPPTLIMTSTLDDRVHPGHARKMVARLEEFAQPVLYFENTEGGHGAAANLEQKVRQRALTISFFLSRLRDGAK